MTKIACLSKFAIALSVLLTVALGLTSCQTSREQALSEDVPGATVVKDPSMIRGAFTQVTGGQLPDDLGGGSTYFASTNGSLDGSIAYHEFNVTIPPYAVPQVITSVRAASGGNATHRRPTWQGEQETETFGQLEFSKEGTHRVDFPIASAPGKSGRMLLDAETGHLYVRAWVAE